MEKHIREGECLVTFQTILNDYLAQLGCTARELSAVSGISDRLIDMDAGEAGIPEPLHRRVPTSIGPTIAGMPTKTRDS